ncbi:MAG: hypothetical protein ABSD29_23235 [Verrucomicrobiota bacterium]
MQKIFAAVLVLLAPVWARAEEVYHIHRLSETELLKTYNSLMRDACRHADQFWQDWPVDGRAGFWGNGRSDEGGVRPISSMTLTCAALLKYSDTLSPAERQEYKRKVVAAIRYVTATHVTGGQKCPDGKSWGNSWQSAMWTCDLAFGGWLMWDDLDTGLRADLERVVAFEADRFLVIKPPTGSFNDTKAEENGWDLVCIVLAHNMFADHPHAAAWRQKALEYMMNTLSAPQDQFDEQIVDGRAVKDWFVGANVHPDFTLENHGFFHPSYVGCSCYFLTQTAMYFTYAHQPVPAAAGHHLMDTWRMFEEILLPNGESAYPQGMDWELHGATPYINLFAALARWQQDSMAARLEETYLQYVRAWQVRQQGDLAVSGSRFGFPRHAVGAEQETYGFLAHKIFGPPAKELTATAAASIALGIRTHDWTEVVSHRTRDKFVSFSWTNRIMGMLVPLGSGHEGNPDFTVPIINGFVGGFDLSPRGDAKTVALGHCWTTTTNGFETTGTLLLNGGRLKQMLRLMSIGSKTVVYQDRVSALKDVTVTQERGVPFGIENDEVTGGKRLLYYQGGQTVFIQRKLQPALAIPGAWANVDGRLGAVSVAGEGMAYVQATGYAPGISVYSDVFYGSYGREPKPFKAGEEVAHRVILFFAEVTPKETAALAESFKIETHGRSPVLRFKIPEGGEAEIPLL